MKPADDSQPCYFCGNPLVRGKGRRPLHIGLFNDAVSSSGCRLLDVRMVKDNGLDRLSGGLIWGKKVKFSRYRPGVAQRVGRCIALLFPDRGTRRG